MAVKSFAQNNNAAALAAPLLAYAGSADLRERAAAIALIDKLFTRSKEFRSSVMSASAFKSLVARLRRHDAVAARTILQAWQAKFDSPALAVALHSIKAEAAPVAAPAAVAAPLRQADYEDARAVARAFHVFRGAIDRTGHGDDDDVDEMVGTLQRAWDLATAMETALSLSSHPLFASAAAASVAAAAATEVEWETDDDAPIEARAAAALSFVPEDYSVVVSAPQLDADVAQSVRDTRLESERVVLPAIRTMESRVAAWPNAPADVVEGLREARARLQRVLELEAKGAVDLFA